MFSLLSRCSYQGVGGGEFLLGILQTMQEEWILFTKNMSRRWKDEAAMCASRSPIILQCMSGAVLCLVKMSIELILLQESFCKNQDRVSFYQPKWKDSQ